MDEMCAAQIRIKRPVEGSSCVNLHKKRSYTTTIVLTNSTAPSLRTFIKTAVAMKMSR